MRWIKPEVDDIRVITRFLFLPRRIRNEVRWLEIVKIRQIFEYYGYGYRWEDSAFINHKKEDSHGRA